MTRFKELSRIEAAIKNRNKSELDWALSYCTMRLGLAADKQHIKHWHRLEESVLQALEESARISG